VAVLRTYHHPHHSVYKLRTECYRPSSWAALLLKMGPIGCHETLLRNYHSTLRKIPKERRFVGLILLRC